MDTKDAAFTKNYFVGFASLAADLVFLFFSAPLRLRVKPFRPFEKTIIQISPRAVEVVGKTTSTFLEET